MPVANPPLSPWVDFQAYLARENFLRNIQQARQQGNGFSPMFGFPHVGTRAGRPNQVIYNPDGTKSSERSFGTEMDGQEVVLPSIVPDPQGYLQKYGQEEAVRLHRQGRNPALGRFNTRQEADDFARQRSEHGGRNWTPR